MKLDMHVIAFGVPLVAGVVLALIGPPGTQTSGSHLRDTVVPPPSAVAPFALRSVSVDLPASTVTFSGGAAADAINANCLSCHSAGMVLTQPTLPGAAWQGIVEKMMHAYKAPVPPKDEAAIVDYLSR